MTDEDIEKAAKKLNVPMMEFDQLRALIKIAKWVNEDWREKYHLERIKLLKEINELKFALNIATMPGTPDIELTDGDIEEFAIEYGRQHSVSGNIYAAVIEAAKWAREYRKQK